MHHSPSEKVLTETKKESNVCRWWQSHKWSKWKITAKGTYLGWPVIIQQRTCARCGYVEQQEET